MEFSLYVAMAPMGTLPRELGYARFFCPFEKEIPQKEALPDGILPILTDSTPYAGQSAETLAQEWLPLLQGCPGVVLDFQQKGQPGVWDFVQEFRRLIPCPVAAPPEYAGTEGPVFLPPIPPDTPPEEALTPGQGREIWLDLAGCGRKLTLTPMGCRGEDWDAGEAQGYPEEALCCHYRVTKPQANTFQFLLWRGKTDLIRLMEKGNQLGVRRYVGLYPELSSCGFLPAHSAPGSDR